MSIAELHKELQRLGIPAEGYFLHGLYGSANDSDKLSLLIRKGERFIEYEIYVSEKGQKHTIATFIHEQDACAYFLKRISENKNIL